MRRLYNTVAIPKITYAADVWYTPTRRREGTKRSQGSVGITKRIASLQRLASIAITGALRTTASDTLDIHASTLPVDLLLRRTCIRTAIRLASLPETHPLHPVFKIRSRRYIKSHRSALHELAHLLGLPPAEVENITPANFPPGEELKCKTLILNSADESIVRAMESTASTRIYSDGSGQDGNTGVAAVMYGPTGSPKVLRYRLGSLTDHTSFEAEAVGLMLALHLLRRKRDTQRATIWMDNQAVIQALSARKARPAQYLIDAIRSQIKGIWRRANHPCFQLEIEWVKGHADVAGNERVDSEAKRAAKGEISRTCALPHTLADAPLPSSVTALKQKHDVNIKREWMEKWKTSTRYQKMSQIDPTMPSNKFRRLTAELTRKQISILVQLHTGHIPLSRYLYRITKVDSPTCPTCRSDDETVHHFLFDCTTWKHERWHMGAKLGRASKSIVKVLNTQKGIGEVLKFVGRTGRFRGCYGDLPT
jgi:ribonuclease HI